MTKKMQASESNPGKLAIAAPWIRSVVLVFLMLWAQIQVTAQHPYFFSLNDENGLPSNEVYRILQDQHGYIWIGCDAGLYRYDGLSWKGYSNSRQNSRSMSNLHLDDKNRVWCANFTGQIFRVSGDSLLMIADYHESSGKFAIAFDSSGCWKLSKNYLEKLDEFGKTTVRRNVSLPFEVNPNGATMLVKNGRLWVEIPGGGLYVISLDNGSLQEVIDYRRSVIPKYSRLFLYGKDVCLYRDDPELKMPQFVRIDEQLSIDVLGIVDTRIRDRTFWLYEDQNGNLWKCTSQGAFCLTNDKITQHCFPDFRISSMLQDREGNYWFTDLQNGIHVIPEMQAIRYNQTSEVGGSTLEVTAMAVTPNSLVIGHYNANLSELFKLPGTVLRNVTVVSETPGLTVKDIYTFGNAALISRGALCYWDIGNNKFKQFIWHINARSVVANKEYVYAVHPEFVTKFTWDELIEGSELQNGIIHPVGGRKIIWVPESALSPQQAYCALNNGLHIMKNDRFFPITWKGETVYAHCFSGWGPDVWAGTQAHGIIQLKGDQIIKQFPLTGLKDPVPKVIQASDSVIWVCTNSDFVRVQMRTGEVKTFSKSIGINPKDVTDMVVWGSYLYTGSTKGIIRIPVDLMPENLVAPPIRFVSITVDGVPADEGIRLRHDFANLRFEVFAHSYRSRKELKYQYRLVGFEDEWKELLYNQPFVNFASLPAGEYVFEIRALNESGLAGESITWKFSVDSPFWQQTWFYLLIALGSIGAVALVFQYRIKVIRKRNLIEKKMIASQLSALKAQMNPHFMYNALNSIQALILKQDIKSSNMYLSKFSMLMRKVLDVSGQEFISLTEECEILRLYLDLEKLRFGNDFHFQLDIDTRISPDYMSLPPLIIQPYVENAIKHGLLHKKGEKKLSVEFCKNHDVMSCLITDNGVGRVRSMEFNARKSTHRSFATRAVETQLDLLNKYSRSGYQVIITDLYEDEIPVGTKVEIRIPVDAK